MTDFALNGFYALLFIGSVLLLLVMLAAPVEYAAKHSPRFAEWLDRAVERVFR